MGNQVFHYMLVLEKKMMAAARERDWLKDARAGSREALGKLLQDFQGYLHRLASRRLGSDLLSKASAADLVQETFLEAQRDFSRFRGNSQAELRVWLRQILQHNLANFQREFRATGKRRLSRERPESTQDIPASKDTSPSHQAMLREEAEFLKVALAALTEEEQRVLFLRYQERQTFQEIARLTGRSVSGARMVCLRVVKKLRKYLRKLSDTD